MKRLLSLALLLGALLGLFGEQAAFAVGPAWHPIATAASAGADAMDASARDCMRMMGENPAKKPCTGLTLDCIAAMGCVVPLTLVDGPSVMGELPIRRDVLSETIFLDLGGRELAPEPEPPTLLI